jgi:hypothetical protein
LIEDLLAAGGDHGTPLGQGWLSAEAEKAEPGGGENDPSHIQRRAHDQRWHAHGHDVSHDDTPGGGAQQAGGGDVVGITDDERLGTGDACIRRPSGQCNGDDGVDDPGSERRHEREREH